MMFALIFICVLFNNADPGVSNMENDCHHKYSDYCDTLREETITAEAGLCVVIPCSFTTSASFEAKHVFWYKCEQRERRCPENSMIFSTKTNDTVMSWYKGRVSLLEPNVPKNNCGIIINDLSVTDSGLYWFRVDSTNGEKAEIFTSISKTMLSVKGLTQKPSLCIPELKEGQQSTLSCTAPGLCSGSAPEITWMLSGAGENDFNMTGKVTEFKMENMSAVSHRSSLRFKSSAKHHQTNITCKVTFKNKITTERTMTLKVLYVKKPTVIGNRTVKEGDALNLTCRGKSFPPSLITWNKRDSSQTLNNGTGSAILIIPNMTAEHFGKYICKAYHLLLNRTTQTAVNMTLSPRILNRSACEVKADVLTCLCVSEGFPLPTIKWPLIKNGTKYCVSNGVSRNTVWTNITLAVKDHSYTTVVCVSSNSIGEATKHLKVNTKNVSQPEGPPTGIWENVKKTEFIIGFLTGVILTGAICFLGKKCLRKKHNSSGNVENLEMMTTNAASQMDACPVMDQGGAAGGAPGCSIDLGEIHYSEIDFSLLKNRSPSRAKGIRESTKSEYAEIKIQKSEDRQKNVGLEDEILEENKEEEVMMENKEVMAVEQKDCVSEQKEGDEVALYSNMKGLMGEI